MAGPLHKLLQNHKLHLVIVILFINSVAGSEPYHDGLFSSGSVYCEGRKCNFKSGVLDWKNAAAAGTFNDTLLVTGWGILDIGAGLSQSHSISDADLMFAAGFLEGVFTAKQIENQFTNSKASFFPKPNDPVKEKLRQWLEQQRDWADQMVSDHQDSPLWRHTGYILSQLDGLYEGYRSVRKDSKTALDKFAFNFLNGIGDLIDLMSVLDESRFPDWEKFTPEEAERYFYDNTHCSALIKMLPGYENVYMSHSSWFLYQTTNRIYKHYNFNVSDPATAAKKISFSSYPGFLESLDDFYHLGSGMVLLQTTNNVFNKTLYKKVHPQSLLAWQRVRVANMMAHGGQEWAETFAMYNSGTYNNQYMVIDLKLIQPQQPLPDNTLWVVEQIPGLVEADDVTVLLKTGYFPSYNVPFFERIYKESGYPEYVKKHGVHYTYQLAPRAEIFRRDADKVSDMDSMKKIMRYNDFKNDPYSGGSPNGAICSRGDLDKSKPRPDGCYDTKVSDLSMALTFQADIINGPTLGSGFEPFSWTGRFANTSHVGLPTTYDFPFIRTKPRFW